MSANSCQLLHRMDYSIAALHDLLTYYALKNKNKKIVFIKHTFWCVKETSPLRHFLYTSKRECVFTECEVLV